MPKEFFTSYTPEEIVSLITIALKQEVIKEIISDAIQKEMNEVYLKPSEVCKMFRPNISRQTLSRWVANGLIQKCVIGSATCFKLSDVKAAVKSMQRYSNKHSNLNTNL
jgi:hypothetical protein